MLYNQSKAVVHSLDFNIDFFNVVAGVLQALASMSMHTKLKTCALIKQATLDGSSLKLVDKFTYLGRSVSSTEKDIDRRLTKAWIAIDKISIIWRSDLTDKMKRSFFQAAVAIWMHNLDANKTAGEKAWRQLHKNAASNIEQVLEATPNKAPTIRPPTFHHENYPS